MKVILVLFLSFFSITACANSLRLSPIDNYRVKHGLSSFEGGGFLNSYYLPDKKFKIKKVYYRSGKFTESKVDLSHLDTKAIRSKHVAAMNGILENVLNFKESVKLGGDYALWRSLHNGNYKISLNFNFGMISSLLIINNESYEFEGGVVDNIYEFEDDTIVISLLYCGATSCSSELKSFKK
ncbi:MULTISPECIES: hypothetical protein [Pseudoalteromonas]|uniref:Lipoprotein n=1 Tax=Pseudoalteromonas luteoviolacea (strain 2ta16) TaxID=1353533 RepID=V4HVW7_PSEL2|nr:MULTISPECIES: hypothetical protein [Pseudoalteromonas]ESP94955.1 hypothetical protein PL2TA16_04511 [Pseudoalteromonas luteoviolacea 2ta16]KZN30730.1 hypothetical protein N483_27320 [Pseudoalteromonas luteoviolacea NCIMB 1944]MCG7551788.1 hypothetical protein [Pseudoalteromonas sp. Of7M-16]